MAFRQRLLLMPFFVSAPRILGLSVRSHSEGRSPNVRRVIKARSLRVQEENARGLTLGAPRGCPANGSYATAGGVGVTRSVTVVPQHDVDNRINELIDALDYRRGVLLASSYEYPGRYCRWTLGFVDPPLELSGQDRYFKLRALNERGEVMLAMFEESLRRSPAICQLDGSRRELAGTLTGAAHFVLSEESRSKQPSLLSILRVLVTVLYHPEEPQLGLYGSFGYDLMFQFEPFEKRIERHQRQRDLLLYIPDSILVVDQRENSAWQVTYDFSWCSPGDTRAVNTANVARTGSAIAYQPEVADRSFQARDMPSGDFSKLVDIAKREFKAGNLFEVVLSQQWRLQCCAKPSSIFRVLRQKNPSPYGFLINLGGDYHKSEFLIGASPEMFVRVERVSDGRLRVETCPISGTIERGADALEDASQVRALLASTKDESELTMCTDVDRNDKSRVCIPGSVSVLGRRQIEMYSRLIHTVDHVEGYLRNGFDALDAFLCHTWAVTVTGAPKSWAARFIERHERTQRAWYGGAVGHVGFDGSLNTGLTLRTIHLVDGVAAVRAGATLLFDSEGESEEAETELKASAMIDALHTAERSRASGSQKVVSPSLTVVEPVESDPHMFGISKRVLLVDHEDSFVHTLADYIRQTRAYVRVCRFGTPTQLALQEPEPWDLLVLSPGPGRPNDFNISGTLDVAIRMRVPIFGVCLGLQGIVEYFGGGLGCLDAPVHGKPSVINTLLTADDMSWGTFHGLPRSFEVGRYHSLYASSVPEKLVVTAQTKVDNIPMAVEHTVLPVAAVQFHPESILTNPRYGLRILSNCLKGLRYTQE